MHQLEHLYQEASVKHNYPFFLKILLQISLILHFRFLVGLGNGILLSSVYSVEIASADKRGTVVMVELTFRCLGVISASLLG